MYKEKEVIHAEIRTYTFTTSGARIQLPDHLATLALKINAVITVQVFFSAIHTVWNLWSCIHIEIKDTFDKN